VTSDEINIATPVWMAARTSRPQKLFPGWDRENINDREHGVSQRKTTEFQQPLHLCGVPLCVPVPSVVQAFLLVRLQGSQ